MNAKWEKLISFIKTHLDKSSFDTWFSSLKPTSLINSSFIVELPNKFTEEWITDSYSKLIQEALLYISNNDQNFSISFKISDQKSDSHKHVHPNKSLEKSGDDLFISLKKHNLDPSYSFNQFVEGDSNQFALSASMAVSENPGKNYNPLFIYGGTGLGKTHLLQAIAQEIIKNHKNYLVKYTFTEAFISDFIKHARFKSIDDFKAEYRKVDVLLIDDIQSLYGKEATQNEFFNTFNTLYENQKQIIIASDRLPKELDKIDERLLSRFASGLIVDIKPPDLETRTAILIKKAENLQVNIPTEILSYIASKIKTNMRTLVGVLTSLVALNSLTKKDFSISLADELLQNYINTPLEKVTIESIQNIVADYYNVTVKNIISTERKRDFVTPRHVAMYLSREITNESYPNIGKKFGNRDHSSVVIAVKKMNETLNNNLLLKNDIQQILKKIET